MSSFLDQVQVINVVNAAGGTFAVTAPPEPPTPPETPESSDDAMAELRAKIAKIKANAKAIAASAKAKAKADLEQVRVSTARIAAEIDQDNDKDGDESGVTTIQSGTNKVVVHHKRSDADEAYVAIPIVAMVFVFLIVRAVMAPFTQRAAAKRGGMAPAPGAQGLTEDEQAILLKLQRTIGQMERRIESLETILIDETRTKEKYGTQH